MSIEAASRCIHSFTVLCCYFFASSKDSSEQYFLFAYAVKSEIVTLRLMKVMGPGVGNKTDKPEYENQFLRQQDLAIISTAGQSDTLR